MYKDKDKQREAQKQWVRQKRANKGSTEQGSTTEANVNPHKLRAYKQLTPEEIAELKPSGTMTPEGLKPQVPANYGQLDCECRHCRANGNKHKLNHGQYKTASQLATGEINRVSLPGDVDYKPKTFRGTSIVYDSPLYDEAEELKDEVLA